ncbi:MAG: Ig-like domain-containing protein [archaeon]
MDLNYPLKLSKKTIDIRQRKKKLVAIDTILQLPPDVADIDSLCRFLHGKYGGGRYVIEDNAGNLLFEGLVFSDSFNVLGGAFREMQQPSTQVKMPILVTELRKIDRRLKEDLSKEREILAESIAVLREIKGELRQDIDTIKSDVSDLEKANRDNKKLIHGARFDADFELKKYSMLIHKQSEAIEALLEQNRALLEKIAGRERAKRKPKAKKAKPKKVKKPKAKKKPAKAKPKPKPKPKKKAKKLKPKKKPAKKPKTKRAKPKAKKPKKRQTKAKPKKQAKLAAKKPPAKAPKRKRKPRRPAKPQTTSIKQQKKKKRKRRRLATPKTTVAAYFDKSPVTLTGKADPGTTVEVFVNRASAGRALASKTGSFSISSVKLKKGENLVIVHSFDDHGNMSPKSKPMKIILGEKKPAKPKAPSKPVAAVSA